MVQIRLGRLNFEGFQGAGNRNKATGFYLVAGI
jgi:hypothetical protein